MGFSFRFSSYFKVADSKILPLSRQSCFALSDFKTADSKILPLSRQSCFALSDFLVVRSGETKYMLRMCLVSFLTTKKPLTESTSVKGESTFRGATLLHDNMRALSGY